MPLNFPNDSRSYDERRQVIRFQGYDSAKEIPFFLEIGALVKLRPLTRDREEGYLEAFDVLRDRIHEAARKAYGRGGRQAYLLVASDF